MKRLSVAIAAALCLTAPSAAEAHAASWKSCPGPAATAQWGHEGVYLTTSNLRVRAPMNCASGRYALKVARRKFSRSNNARLPSVYNDGYVLWLGHVRRGSTWNMDGQYDEYESGTAFRFHARWLSD